MKPAARQIAIERMQILIESAIKNASADPSLSERHAFLAHRISTRYKIQMPFNFRMLFCKKCKSFIVPGVNSKIRLGRASVKSVRVSCNLCGHIYRKIIHQRP